MSRKCSEQFGLWTKERIQFNLKMNRQEIFRIVEMLEQNEELKPTRKLSIPRFVLNTLINEVEQDIQLPSSTVNLHKFEVQSHQKSSDSIHPQFGVHKPERKTSLPPSRPSSNTRPQPSQSPARPSPNTRSTSVHQPYGRSRPTQFSSQNTRVASKSPNIRDKNSERGRSSDKSLKQRERTASSHSAERQIKTLKFQSYMSNSPTRRQASVPTVFKRRLTPNTRAHMNKSYFAPTSGQKYQDVWKSGRCIRCYSSEHRAVMCPKYTQPCPELCRFCQFLYHSNCKQYDQYGKSRPVAPTDNSTPCSVTPTR